jgi:hypothetical protein
LLRRGMTKDRCSGERLEEIGGTLLLFDKKLPAEAGN